MALQRAEFLPERLTLRLFPVQLVLDP